MIVHIEDIPFTKWFLIIICLYVCHSVGVGQDLNLLIHPDSLNRTVSGFYENESEYVIPYIDISPNSKIIFVNKNTGNHYINDNYKNIKFSIFGLINIGDQFFVYGKNRSKKKALKLLKLDTFYNPVWTKEIPTKADYNFPLQPQSIDSFLYLSGIIEYDSLDDRHSFLIKVDPTGNVNWTKYYNEDLSYSLPYMTKQSKDGHLLVSSAVTGHSEFGRYSQMLKLDTAGNNVWEFYSTEEMEHGAIAPWFVQLSDSTIVQSYRKDEWDNDSLWLNDLNSYPYRFVWLDPKTGQVLKRKFIHFHKYTFMYYSGMKEGKRDYFYAYGHWENKQSRIKGLLMKYSNSGDTIWQRKYVHPDFNTEDETTTIDEIVEHDNGDITIVANIRLNYDYNKTWIFTVDSNGCFETDSCGEQVVVSTQDNQTKQQEIKVYPNPVDDIIYVEPSINLFLYGARFHLYDVHGRKVIDRMLKQGQHSISVSNLAPGIYFYKVIVDGKDISSGKLIK